jgi:hypothetical protein
VELIFAGVLAATSLLNAYSVLRNRQVDMPFPLQTGASQFGRIAITAVHIALFAAFIWLWSSDR